MKNERRGRLKSNLRRSKRKKLRRRGTEKRSKPGRRSWHERGG